MKIVEYADRDMAAIDLANVLAEDLETALLHHDTASIAVPGGTTPGPIFDALCAADLDWSRVRVMLTDERWVPEGDPRSNTTLVKDRLITARAAAATFVPFYAPADEPDSVLADVEALISPNLPLSVVVLGMGADMHTASLFPGMRGLKQALAADAPVLVPARPDSQPETRVSLSARVLDSALAKHLVIFGADKRAALERAVKLPPEEAPIVSVLGGMTVHWAE